MLAFLALRIGYTIAVALATVTFVFALLHLAGDPLAALVPPGSSPEQEAALRAHYGLDESMPEQYWLFLKSAIQGDFGDSWVSDRPAMSVVLERFPHTLALAGLALVLAIVVSVPLGVLAALSPNGVASWFLTFISAAGQSLAAFWFGTLLVLTFAVRLQWLPASGDSGWQSWIMPVMTLALYPIAILCRLTRVAVQETLHEDFIRTAVGKGLQPATTVRRHVLPNAILPIVAMCGVQAAFLIGGSAAVEAVFAWPGAGLLALQSVSNRDVPVVLAFVTIVAIAIALTTMAVDLIAAFIDPRTRESLPAGGGS